VACAIAISNIVFPDISTYLNPYGVDCVAQFNWEASRKANKPMMDISYCMTKALNQVILETVQFDKGKFKSSHLGDGNW